MATSTTSIRAGRRMARRSPSFRIAAGTRRCGSSKYSEVPSTNLRVKNRKYLVPMGRLNVIVLDENGRETAARISITGEDGRAYAPHDAWMHADDSFDRSQSAFEAHYFHTTGAADVEVPAGRVTVDVMRGFEHRVASQTVEVKAGADRLRLRSDCSLWICRRAEHSHWVSGDVHVHMNYGGAYRNTPSHLVFQAAAERSADRAGSRRQQGTAHSGYRLFPHHAGPGIHRQQSPAARAGISHQLLGTPRACFI